MDIFFHFLFGDFTPTLFFSPLLIPTRLSHYLSKHFSRPSMHVARWLKSTTAHKIIYKIILFIEGKKKDKLILILSIKIKYLYREINAKNNIRLGEMLEVDVQVQSLISSVGSPI